MLKRLKTWHAGLSRVGKITAWSLAIMGAATVNAISSPQPSIKADPKPQIMQTQPEVQSKVETKTVTETVSLPFNSTQVEDSSLAKGSTAIRTPGANGSKTLTYEVTYQDGKELKKLVKEEVTAAPVDQVTAIGTYVKPAAPANNCDPNYRPCVPNVSYDLDCPDIGFRVTVIGTDRHGFDGSDNDGLGCESY